MTKPTFAQGRLAWILLPLLSLLVVACSDPDHNATSDQSPAGPITLDWDDVYDKGFPMGKSVTLTGYIAFPREKKGEITFAIQPRKNSFYPRFNLSIKGLIPADARDKFLTGVVAASKTLIVGRLEPHTAEYVKLLTLAGDTLDEGSKVTLTGVIHKEENSPRLLTISALEVPEDTYEKDLVQAPVLNQKLIDNPPREETFCQVKGRFTLPDRISANFLKSNVHLDFTCEDGRILKGVSIDTHNAPFPNVVRRMGDGYHELRFWDMNREEFTDQDQVTLYGIWNSKGKKFHLEEIVKGA